MHVQSLKLSAAHEALVQHIATRLKHQLELFVADEDLLAWGYQGLFEALLRYRRDRGAQFSTFAYYRVRGAMLDGVRKQGWLSRRAYARLKAVRTADELAESVGGTLPREKAAAFHDRSAELQRILEGVVASYTLAAAGHTADGYRSPEAMAEHTQQLRAVRQCLDALPWRERELIQALFFEDATLAEASARVGISKSWASRTTARALAQIRHTLCELEA